MSCEEILKNSYEESSLNNFEKNKFNDLLENRYPQYDEMFASASIESNIENDTWEDIKEKLKVTTGEDLNMMDNGSYSRAQQAIDYVDRVKSYYQLMSAHACVNPKDQLTFF